MPIPQPGGPPLAGCPQLSYSVYSQLCTRFCTRTLREECRLRVFENRVLRSIFEPRRDKVTGGWKKLHNEDLHNVTWMAQQEVGGRVNSVDSRGDITYPHSFHQYTTLGKHSLPHGDVTRNKAMVTTRQRCQATPVNTVTRQQGSEPFSRCLAEGL
jgi:hypothetical protein